MNFQYSNVVFNLSQLLREILNQEKINLYDKRFLKLCGELIDKEKARKSVTRIKYLFDLGRIKIEDKIILDAGCGFGIDCLILRLLGAKEVHGIDISQVKINTFKSYLTNHNLPIYPRLDDVTRLDYKNETFDVVLSVEAISHYRDIDQFLSQAARVLKKGGVLIISDSNNACNPLISRRTKRIWEVFENGPPTENIYGHIVKMPYVVARKEKIKREFPLLSESESDMLSKATSGMWGEQITDACRKYLQDKIKPKNKYKYGICPISPDGAYIENLFKPPLLKKKIESFGFSVKFFSHFGCTKNYFVVFLNAILRQFTPITIYVAPGFKIVAKKI